MNEMNKILLAKKISIFGYPATGKTTLAIFLEQLSSIKLYCIDQLRYEKTSYKKRSIEEFEKDYYKIFKEDFWIIEGNALEYIDQRLKESDVLIYFRSNRYLSVFKCILRFFRSNVLKIEKRLGTNWKKNYFHLGAMNWIINRYHQKIEILKKDFIIYQDKIIIVKSYCQLKKMIKELKKMKLTC